MSVTNYSNCRMSVVTRRLYSGLLCLRSPLVVCIPRILSSQGACRLFTCISECFRLVLILCGCISVTLIRYLVVKAFTSITNVQVSVLLLIHYFANLRITALKDDNTIHIPIDELVLTEHKRTMLLHENSSKSNQIKSNQKKCKHLTCDQKLTGNQFSLLHVQK